MILMPEKTFVGFEVGLLRVNCYLVPSGDGRILYIIDPGDNAGLIMDNVRKFSFEEAVILFTHCHVDHISAAGEIAEKLGIRRVYIHPDDQAFYSSPDNNLLPYIPAAENLPVLSKWPPVSDDFEVIHTPGHSRGGVCYYFKKLNALFTGDTLFNCSVGRTDFVGGSSSALMDSISRKLLTLPPDLEIFPGHGDSSTIGFEKANNPFIN